jgi:ribosome-associated toxin RatA of RatAB toxin-antitoxin module
MTPLDPTSLAALGRGKVLVSSHKVPGAKTPKLLVKAVVEAPPAKAWAVIDGASRYQEFMPRVKSSVELSREGDSVRTRLTVGMPFPLKDLTGITVGDHSVEEGVRYSRAWTLESGDYERNDGCWTLTPFQGDVKRTLVIYELHVEPKIRIPKRIAAAVQEKAMPQLIQAVRDRIRSLG